VRRPREVRELSRRDFIKTVGIGIGALPTVGFVIGTLTGCGSSPQPQPPTPVIQTVRWPIHSLAAAASTTIAWMQEFFNTTSNPVGYGFGQVLRPERS
jgi:hypothetical protein